MTDMDRLRRKVASNPQAEWEESWRLLLEEAVAEIDLLRAEVEMLRGVGCSEDGDGPCGVCIKCYKNRAEAAGREANVLLARADAAEMCDACSGSGRAASGPCGCGGTGKLADMLRNVRIALHEQRVLADGLSNKLIDALGDAVSRNTFVRSDPDAEVSAAIKARAELDALADTTAAAEAHEARIIEACAGCIADDDQQIAPAEYTPVVNAMVERDRRVEAKALRAAADATEGDEVGPGWLRARADEIERGGR